MGEYKLLGLALSRRAVMIGAITLFVTAVAACSSGASVPENGQTPGPNSPGEIQDSGDSQGSGEAQVTGELEVPGFDVDAFADINPDPEIRIFDRAADLKGELDYFEETRIPRDAIRPVYSPAFVSPAEATLLATELVMGLEINGDARAYPVGMLRIREIVNDEVGGIPVLVTW